ncbi:hypothetical protein F5879DRAFT_1025042 [Lentinula edodes]|nr:hypothetical protein F5879DRAFT_1025042 [Lentinula edodes]
MAGDGTNDGTKDIGALKQAHIGVAILDGTPEDLQKIAEQQKVERVKQVYESQLKISTRFNQPPSPVPVGIAHLFPDAVQAQQKAAASQMEGRKRNPTEKFNLAGITDKRRRRGPKDRVLLHISAVTHIIRQSQCTLIVTDYNLQLLTGPQEIQSVPTSLQWFRMRRAIFQAVASFEVASSLQRRGPFCTTIERCQSGPLRAPNMTAVIGVRNDETKSH